MLRELNPKNDGARYREAHRRGQSLTRLRQEARMIKKHRQNTDGEAMAQLQREMQRVATAN